MIIAVNHKWLLCFESALVFGVCDSSYNGCLSCFSHVFDINSISLLREYGEESYVLNKQANKLKVKQWTTPTYILLQRCGWILYTERKFFHLQEPRSTPTISSYLLTKQEDTKLGPPQVVVYIGTIACQLG